MDQIPLSTLILTLNEEENLPHCLSSLNWCNDIVVLDSHSSDNTIDIAKKNNCRIFFRHFDNYANQRNHGINAIEYKNPWILMVDADEEVPIELVSEINSIIESGEDDICLYRMRRKDFFLGRWIKHSSGYPTWFGRLIRPGHVRVERAINEEYNTDGSIGFLNCHLKHYPFNKGFDSWFEKHNLYSAVEAELIEAGGMEVPTLSDFFDSDPANRRRAVKRLFYRLPFRPFLMFIALYVFKRGFLDGRAGLTFCLLRSYYEFMINCKVKEFRLRKQGLPL